MSEKWIVNCFFTPMISKDVETTFSKESPIRFPRFPFPKNGIKPNSPDYIHGHDKFLLIDAALTVKESAPTSHTCTQFMKLKLSGKYSSARNVLIAASNCL